MSVLTDAPLRAALRSGPLADLLTAVQFLTRLPTPQLPFDALSLPRALPWFPLVGAVIGAAAGMADRLLAPHLAPVAAAVSAVTACVLLTGALHEDALADCADGFGLRRTRERTLAIMRDSRIGSFGGVALVLSIATRIALIAALPRERVLPVLVAAGALSRWSTLPLALVPAARAEEGGQGVTIAGRLRWPALLTGTALAFGIAALALRIGAFAPVLASVLVIAATGAFYRKRLGGVTGDCFGATNQLVEIAVLTCGAWTA